MIRLLIAAALLIGFVVAMKSGLNQALLSWGFWPYALICIGIAGAAIAASFAYDRATSRSR